MWNNNLGDISIWNLNSVKEIQAWHFCDNRVDANECARLVLAGKKRATSTSIWELEIQNLPIPKAGDLNIVTNWEGEAQCVIQTIRTERVLYREITDEHAAIEGEGDRSLEYWRHVHWNYYKRVLRESSYEVAVDMPIIFEKFKVVYPII